MTVTAPRSSTVTSVRSQHCRTSRGAHTQRHVLTPHKDGVEKPGGEDEGEGDDDDEAEGLGVGQDDDQGKLEEVHQLVEGALHAVDDAALGGHHLLQEQLGDGQVGDPHA